MASEHSSHLDPLTDSLLCKFPIPVLSCLPLVSSVVLMVHVFLLLALLALLACVFSLILFLILFSKWDGSSRGGPHGPLKPSMLQVTPSFESCTSYL